MEKIIKLFFGLFMFGIVTLTVHYIAPSLNAVNKSMMQITSNTGTQSNIKLPDIEINTEKTEIQTEAKIAEKTGTKIAEKATVRVGAKVVEKSVEKGIVGIISEIL